MPSFLKLSGISKSYGGVRALTDVDMSIEVGEVHCLVGQNGCGKSTLIKIISGVEAPEPGGHIEIEGHAYAALAPQESTRRGIQVIYQDLSLFPNLTVAENIAVAQHLGMVHVVDWKRVRATASAAMTRIGVSLDLDQTVQTLSIANRQIVAICRALAADARLVIMDEPTASLTRHEVNALMDLVRELKAKGISIIFVSHRLDEVLEVADRVTVLRDGLKVGTFPASEVDGKKLAVLMTGKAYAYDLKTIDIEGLPVALEARGLSRAGEFEDVSFKVHAGEILGITGLLGSGRTELALSLFGMAPADRGQILIAGQPARIDSNQAAIAHGIGYVSEDRLTLGIVLDQPIASNMILTVLNDLAQTLGLIPAKARQDTVDHWVRELGIKVSKTENAVKTLSGGNQQRVVLAKWMARRPRVLILDSPTVGVDISAKDGIYEVIQQLAASGVAVIMISDEIPEVLYHSHRVLVMRDGRLTASFIPVKSSEQEVMAAVNE